MNDNDSGEPSVCVSAQRYAGGGPAGKWQELRVWTLVCPEESPPREMAEVRLTEVHAGGYELMFVYGDGSRSHAHFQSETATGAQGLGRAVALACMARLRSGASYPLDLDLVLRQEVEEHFYQYQPRGGVTHQARPAGD